MSSFGLRPSLVPRLMAAMHPSLARRRTRRNSRNISSFRGCLQRPPTARDKQPLVLTQRSCVTSEGIQMNRVMQARLTAMIALAFVGAVQANETALAQEPDKDKTPAAQRAPSAARAAPRAAPAAPRQVARPPARRPAAQDPARAPASVQRGRPQRLAAVQRAQPPERCHQAEHSARRAIASKRSATSRGSPASFRNPAVQSISRNQFNVALAMGSRIPRCHRLYRFAPALLAIIPAYAAYLFAPGGILPR